MNVLEVVDKRRSIRKYAPSPISDGDLEKILEAARLAPSAGNRQPWRFIVVRESHLKRLLAGAAQNRMFLADAGVVVVALADAKASSKWCKQDVMIAVEHMVLASVSLGYGTCWIGAFDELQVKELLGVPEELSAVVLLPIGVPAEEPQAKSRKEFSEIFFGEKYGQPLTL